MKTHFIYSNLDQAVSPQYPLRNSIAICNELEAKLDFDTPAKY